VRRRRRRLVAVVARVRVRLRRRRVGSVALRVLAAGVSNEDGPSLDAVARLAKGRAPVNGVLVVEASACRVELDELVAHFGGCRRCLAMWDSGDCLVGVGDSSLSEMLPRWNELARERTMQWSLVVVSSSVLGLDGRQGEEEGC
jgi:hypothetical protein